MYCKLGYFSLAFTITGLSPVVSRRSCVWSLVFETSLCCLKRNIPSVFIPDNNNAGKCWAAGKSRNYAAFLGCRNSPCLSTPVTVFNKCLPWPSSRTSPCRREQGCCFPGLLCVGCLLMGFHVRSRRFNKHKRITFSPVYPEIHFLWRRANCALALG